MYKLIEQMIQDVIWFRSPEGTFDYISPSAQHLLGYEPQELVGTTIADYFHPNDTNHLQQLLDKVQDGQDVGIFTCRFRHKEGRYLWLENTFTAIHNKNGELVRILGVGRDVTRRKQAENRLLQAERIAHVGSWERDVQSKTLYWSDELYRIFGLDPKPSIPVEVMYSRIHPADLPRVKQAINDADNGSPYDIQYRIIRPSGEIRHVHAQGQVELKDGVVSAVSGSLQDITEYKLATESLQKSKENLKLAQKIARLGHWDWDIINDDLFWSDEVYRIFGMSAADRPDTSLKGFLDSVHPDDRDFVRQSIEDALTGESYDIEYRALLPNGRSSIVHVIGETAFGHAGTPVRLFGTVQDVTVQRQTEDMLRTSEKLSMAGQLAAGIAHEIRNPLTVLKGFVQILSHSETGDKGRYFELMESELCRIETITSELLFLAKPHGVSFEQRDIRVILQEVVVLLGTEAIMRNVLIECDYDDVVTMVTCEASQLKQVFVNIVKNAIEAMPNGGTLSIKVTRVHDSVHIQFTDEGVGIPAESVPRIGAPFYTTKPGGTGLGLMVSQKIILSHGGTLNISSQVGVGTTAEISLPAVFPTSP
ncbi:PAS domain-containing protein [Alicyclobacillus dauci]|uniref:histidine kinase n=1 Tax=Alicyclobacillus dauci TaxID=1475485 RepID=A0ABY6Z1H4_9BACL|nr:PAS domain-containing protein [Alicyclobacillus dauci]WAH36676.1 PAS domain-containing protein [Alicyclobacillus dauci]